MPTRSVASGIGPHDTQCHRGFLYRRVLKNVSPDNDVHPTFFVMLDSRKTTLRTPLVHHLIVYGRFFPHSLVEILELDLIAGFF